MSDTMSAIVTGQDRRQPVPALFIGLCADNPLAPPARIGLDGVMRIEIGRGAQRTVARDGEVIQLGLSDARMSSKHARLTCDRGAWVLEDLQSKNGTWVRRNRIGRRTLEDGDAIIVGHTALVFRLSGGEEPDLDALPRAQPGLATMSTWLAEQFASLAQAARSDVPVEVTGESGTGKELVARATHALSGRRGAFIGVNCGALPGTLLEAELFGHRKGAYTGAADERLGLIRAADRGTLFLDEIAELAPSSQAALLRVLQEGEVLPIGADHPVPVDVRIVTATHKSIDAEVDAGRFRADLRARLLGVSIALPPLRERLEDLGPIASQVLARHRRVGFSIDAIEALYAYPWPLNIRELERALTSAVAVAGELVDRTHLPVPLRASPTEAPRVVAELGEAERALRDQLAAVIERHAGNLTAVAKELGKDRTQIRRWMKRFGMSRDEE